MKKLLFIAVLFFSGSMAHSALNCPSVDHPIKLTSSMIKYEAKYKRIGVVCKVFFDDFSPAISATLLRSINQSNLTKDDLRRIENYFTAHFQININGKIMPWKIESYDIAHRENILTLVFSKTPMTLKKGDDIKIENTLLFEMFGDIQSNWMTLRFPPFLKDYNFESNTFDSVYSYTL